MSLSARATFKIIHLGGHVLNLDFFKSSNNDDKKGKTNSTVN